MMHRGGNRPFRQFGKTVYGLGASAAITVVVAGAVLVGSAAHVASAQRGMGPGMMHDYWQPGWMQRHMWEDGSTHADIEARMRRHRTFMHGTLPAEYRDARSTVKNSVATIKAGGRLYAENCASCHGNEGLGDGKIANSLSPSPALLAYLIERPIAVDSYLLWTISEGGKRFDTDMPAFKNELSRDEIWQVVAYMRSGFPEVDDNAGDGGDTD